MMTRRFCVSPGSGAANAAHPGNRDSATVDQAGEPVSASQYDMTLSRNTSSP